MFDGPWYGPVAIIAAGMLVGAVTTVFRGTKAVIRVLRRADTVFTQILGDPGDPDAGIDPVPSLNARLKVVEDRLDRLDRRTARIADNTERGDGR